MSRQRTVLKTNRAMRRANFDAISIDLETINEPCYVKFNHRFAGLGVYDKHFIYFMFDLPAPGEPFVTLNSGLVCIPLCVLNRFGRVLPEWHVRPKCRIKMEIDNKSFACAAPCYMEFLMKGRGFEFQIGQEECTGQDGQVVFRPVINIVQASKNAVVAPVAKVVEAIKEEVVALENTQALLAS